MEYNHEQEYQADRVAFEILSILGYKQEAMATVLSRIEQDFAVYKGASMYISSETHPSINSRISRLGVPNLDRDVKFEQIVSFAVSNAAMLRYGQGRFMQSLSIIEQNIKNGVATAKDYVLKAKCLLALENSQAAINEILSLLETAKHLDSTNLDIYKTEILAILRGGQMDAAIAKLTDYLSMLSEVDAMNSLTMLFVEQEIDWSKDMLIKLNALR
jgi:predicted Zn-dependent protease